ncbi:MAG: hypothetical protein A3C56_07250 [Ignavibacteria bacterium RIFCSPHIGHO2_02_FULL_56_12]|nr:MAG: hypothetical protein A3C56_07250 [Ignavibacteria bacterium RIFCSPHIGHO2_02_FULL_56_12]
MSLQGITILLTRTAEANAELAAVFNRRGAKTRSLPTIEIVDPASWEGTDKAILDLARYDCVFFTSRNAVERLLHRIEQVQPEAIARLASCKIYAVGEHTEEAIEEAGLTVALTPEVHSAEALAESLGNESLAGRMFLFPKSDIAGDVVPSFLRSAGAAVDEIVVYRNVAPEGNKLDEIRNALANGDIHAVTFFSPSAVRRFVQMLGTKCIGTTPVAVIGRTTGNAARSLGIEPTILPDRASAEAMAEAIERFFNPERQ